MSGKLDGSSFQKNSYGGLSPNVLAPTFSLVSMPPAERLVWYPLLNNEHIDHNTFHDELHHTRILIGSYLRSIRGQTCRWRHHHHLFASVPYTINKTPAMLLKACIIIDPRTRQTWCGKNIRDILDYALCDTLCSYLILTSFVIRCWTDTQQHVIYFLEKS